MKHRFFSGLLNGSEQSWVTLWPFKSSFIPAKTTCFEQSIPHSYDR